MARAATASDAIYNYPSTQTLLAHFRAAADWAAVDLTESDGSGYDGVPTSWLWVHATKACTRQASNPRA